LLKKFSRSEVKGKGCHQTNEPILVIVEAYISMDSGWNHGCKVEGNQGLGPNIGALAPCAWPKAGLGVGCGRGSPPPIVKV